VTDFAELLTVPEEYIPTLRDSEVWRSLGITHWHLTRWDRKLTLKENQFVSEEIADRVARGEACTDPREALLWVMTETAACLVSTSDPEKFFHIRGWKNADDLRRTIDISWEFMTGRPYSFIPIGHLVLFKESHAGSWVANIYAYPQDADRCRRH
jgi:hypothetical protein